MKKSIGLLVAVGALALLALAFIAPALFVEPKPPTDLPWQVQVTPQGGVQVFGVTVGESTLGDVERRFGTSEVTLFRSPQGTTALEAFFESVNLSGLDAKVVVGLRIPPGELNAMYERGARAANLGSGTQKVTLASEDQARVKGAVVETLTYMPFINLKQELVARRFGEPAEKWKEPESGVVHWLYPKFGLGVAFSESAKEVLQYVPPAEFARLRDPLLKGERLP